MDCDTVFRFVVASYCLLGGVFACPSMAEETPDSKSQIGLIEAVKRLQHENEVLKRQMNALLEAFQNHNQPLVEYGDTNGSAWIPTDPPKAPPASNAGYAGHVWVKKTITLSKRFAKRPALVVIPRHEDIINGVRWYSLVQPDQGDPAKFDIIIATWAGTRLAKLEVTWVAIGEEKPPQLTKPSDQ